MSYIEQVMEGIQLAREEFRRARNFFQQLGVAKQYAQLVDIGVDSLRQFRDMSMERMAEVLNAESIDQVIWLTERLKELDNLDAEIRLAGLQRMRSWRSKNPGKTITNDMWSGNRTMGAYNVLKMLFTRFEGWPNPDDPNHPGHRVARLLNTRIGRDTLLSYFDGVVGVTLNQHSDWQGIITELRGAGVKMEPWNGQHADVRGTFEVSQVAELADSPKQEFVIELRFEPGN